MFNQVQVFKDISLKETEFAIKKQLETKFFCLVVLYGDSFKYSYSSFQGENVLIAAEIDNKSSKAMSRTYAKLVQVTTHIDSSCVFCYRPLYFSRFRICHISAETQIKLLKEVFFIAVLCEKYIFNINTVNLRLKWNIINFSTQEDNQDFLNFAPPPKKSA